MKPPLTRIGYLLVILVIVSYAVIALRGPRGIPALLEKRRNIHALEKRNAELAVENERKKQRIERLSHDPAEQERVIKERLKLYHPDEKIYVFPDSKNQDSKK